MKKYIIFLMLFTFMFAFVACDTTIDSPPANFDKNKGDVGTGGGGEAAAELLFDDLKSFETYLYSDQNDPSSNKYFNPNFYIDFSSIISDNEVATVASYDTKVGNLRMIYSGENGLMIDSAYGTYGKRRMENDKNFYISEYTEYKVYNTLSDVPENTNFFIYDRDGNYILYETWKSSTVGDGARISFMIGEYYFKLYADLPAETDSEQALLSAFLPELGATDDSVIAMLDKIKALIPKS